MKYVTPQKKYTGHLHSADFITEDDIFFSSKIQQNHFNSTEEDNPFVYNIGRFYSWTFFLTSRNLILKLFFRKETPPKFQCLMNLENSNTGNYIPLNK